MPGALQLIDTELAQDPAAAEGDQPSTASSTTSSQASNEISPDFPYSKESLYKAFMNAEKIDQDCSVATSRIIPESVKSNKPKSGVKETVLARNFRLSTTIPVALAAKDASKALSEFESEEVGQALTQGLVNVVPKAESEKDADIAYGFDRVEIQQLQRKITEKRDLEIDRLYAQCLRCPADERLDRYIPKSLQTPKPGYVKVELRKAIAEAVEEATKQARYKVFSQYLTGKSLDDMVHRFDRINAQYAADIKLVSKQQSETSESKICATEGRMGRLLRVNAGDAVHEKIAQKINDTREALQRKLRQDKKAKKQEKSDKRFLRHKQAKELMEASKSEQAPKTGGGPFTKHAVNGVH